MLRANYKKEFSYFTFEYERRKKFEWVGTIRVVIFHRTGKLTTQLTDDFNALGLLS